MFRDAKVGEKVYDLRYNWGIVEDVVHTSFPFPVKVYFEKVRIHDSFTYDGKPEKNSNQTLFWDELKFEIPKKPFDLKAEFDKLEVEEFVKGVSNHFLCWCHKDEYWDKDSFGCYEAVSTLYFKYNDKFVAFIELLNKYKITPEQLRPLMIKKLNEVYGE